MLHRGMALLRREHLQAAQFVEARKQTYESARSDIASDKQRQDLICRKLLLCNYLRKVYEFCREPRNGFMITTQDGAIQTVFGTPTVVMRLRSNPQRCGGDSQARSPALENP
jgi:hypothetical protein